jgi:porphobilinogen synthase
MKKTHSLLTPDTPAAEGVSAQRLRRNRKTHWMRRLARECQVTTDDLIWPVFVVEGNKQEQPIAAMPSVARYSLDMLLPQIEKAARLNIPAIALFPVLDLAKKTADGREAYADDNLMARALKTIKKEFPNVGVICDVALDPYTTHGHDGVLDAGGDVANDATVDILCKQALAQAAAGADIVAPSDMMDGRVGRIRAALDGAGFTHVSILSYTAKYASSFYGPFRDAVQTRGLLKGDKKTYQMDPANRMEALREAAEDVAEGADMLMVKPGLPYLDILRAVKDQFGLPTFVYQVSGEFAMMKAAAANGWLDYNAALMESLLCFKRAGADAIFTYAALDAATILNAQPPDFTAALEEARALSARQKG